MGLAVRRLSAKGVHLMPRHPSTRLLAEAAYAGREVTEEELEELQLLADRRRALDQAPEPEQEDQPYDERREEQEPSYCK